MDDMYQFSSEIKKSDCEEVYLILHLIFSGGLGCWDNVNHIEVFKHLFGSSWNSLKYYVDDLASYLVSCIATYRKSCSAKHDHQTSASISDEHLLEFMNSFPNSLNDLVGYNLRTSRTRKATFQILRDFHSFTAKIHVKNKESECLMTGIQSVANIVTDLFYVFGVKAEGWSTVADNISYLDIRTKLLNLESKAPKPMKLSQDSEASMKRHIHGKPPRPPTSNKLLDSNYSQGSPMDEVKHDVASQLVQVNAQILSIEKELEFLKAFLFNLPRHYAEFANFKNLFSFTGALAFKARFFIHNSDLVLKNEQVVLDVDITLSYLLHHTKIIRASIQEIYAHVRKSSRSHFPMTGGLSILDSLLDNLNELLKSKDGSILLLLREIEEAKFSLTFVRSFFIDASKEYKECRFHEEIKMRVIQVAYEVDYAIDSILLKKGKPTSHLLLYLSDVVEEINHIKLEVREIIEQMPASSFLQFGKSFPPVVAQAVPHIDDNVVVGFEEKAEKIIDQLIGGQEELDIISVVGMPGLGKTTFAEKIFNHKIIVDRFQARAWCCISQHYNVEDLLLKIYCQVVGRKGKISEDDVADKLRKILMGKRYFIVLDDMWETAAWDELSRSFPDCENRSRIMLTTRLEEVARHVQFYSDPYYLPFLRKEECWKLLCKMIFHGKSCPLELAKVGNKIAESCKGLPLVVVLVAGFLAKVEKKVSSWLQIADSLNLYMVQDVKKSMDVIELSYKNLQDHLKPCLLYFGAFPEDQEIPVSKLTQLWMAEGFVRKTLGKNLETVAEDQLKDLIASSLVIVAKRRANGTVKSCRVHDLIHDFCLRKGNGENFLQLMRECDFYCLRHTEPHRLSMLLSSHSDDDLGFQIPRGLRGRTLICSSRMENYDWTDVFQQNPEFSWIPDRFKFLRVLDLEMVMVEGDSFFSKIGLLVHLRYLAAKLGGGSYSSTSFENLHNLETLKLKSKHSLYLPHLLQKLSRLRNLHMDKCHLYDSSSGELAFCEGSTGFRHLVTFSAPVADNRLLEDTIRHFPRKDNFFPRCSSEPTEFEASIKLENLQTFSSPLLVCNRVEESIMRGFSGLRMLSCEVLEGGYRYPRLDFLSQLESLRVSCSFTSREAPVNCEFNFPSCLKELTLCGFKLPWSEISRVARLPNLEVFKLLDVAFEGENWDVEHDNFPKLKFLKLCDVSIVNWTVSADSFPILEQLVLKDCELLRDVPSSFADICTLKAVKVDHCNLHVVSSVMKLKDDLLDLGYDGLDITILNSNFKPSSSM